MRTIEKVGLKFLAVRLFIKVVFWYLLVMKFLCWFIDGELFEIFRISIKATHQEALDFYMFHCFNISKHISISVLFLIISVSCFVGGGGCCIFKIIATGMGF